MTIRFCLILLTTKKSLACMLKNYTFRYKLFEKYGSTRNLWSEAEFEMEPLDEDFQIIIESTSGTVHLSDIAIDDFALLTDGDCISEQYATTAVALTEEPGGTYDIQSCANRCDETGPSTMADEIITNGTGRGGIVQHCDCFDGCEDIKSCCLDYLTLCVFCKFCVYFHR